MPSLRLLRRQVARSAACRIGNRENNRVGPELVGGAFAVVGAGLFAAAAGAARKTLRLRRTGARSRAVVAELRARDLRIRAANEPVVDDTVLAPVFEFTAADGVARRVEGNATSPPRYAVGDEVVVLYDPADPDGARVETFAGLWLGPLLAAAGGSVACAVALVLLALSE